MPQSLGEGQQHTPVAWLELPTPLILPLDSPGSNLGNNLSNYWAVRFRWYASSFNVDVFPGLILRLDQGGSGLLLRLDVLGMS